MIESLRLSFTKYDVVSPPKYVGLRNYSYLLTSDPSFWPSVTVTAIYAAISVPLGLIAALGVALLLNRKVAGRGVQLKTKLIRPNLRVLADVPALRAAGGCPDGHSCLEKR